MFKHGIDQDALIKQFSEATASQGEKIRKSVNKATLEALQGRELTLANIRQVLGTVTKAASSGMAKSPLPAVDVEAMLEKAVAGMDGALQKAVQANQRALQQMVDHGANLRETQVKKALADIDKMEGALFDSIRKVAQGAGTQLEGAWTQVLSATQMKGTGTGAQATAVIEQLMASAQKNLSDGRALGMKASQALLDGYATLVSGVLIGMSDALTRSADASAAEAPSARSRKA